MVKACLSVLIHLNRHKCEMFPGHRDWLSVGIESVFSHLLNVSWIQVDISNNIHVSTISIVLPTHLRNAYNQLMLSQNEPTSTQPLSIPFLGRHLTREKKDKDKKSRVLG